MADLNVHRPAWEQELDEAPFRARAMRLGPRAGASEIGASLYEIDPGGAMTPYHLHHGNEELLLVLAGTPQLRTPDGARTLEAGAIVAFPRGPAGAHRITNASTEPVRLLMVSTMNFPDVAEHLDTGTWLTVTGPAEGRAFPAGADIAFMDAVVQSMRAATEREARRD